MGARGGFSSSNYLSHGADLFQLTTTQATSISFWFYPITGSANLMAVSVGDDGNPNRFTGVRIGSLQVVALQHRNTGNNTATTTATYNYDTWNYCGVVLTPSVSIGEYTIDIYLNSTTAETFNVTGWDNIIATSDITTIGVRADNKATGGSPDPQGFVRDMGIWQNYDIGSDVQNLLNNWKPWQVGTGSLTGAWSLQGTGNESDLSGNSADMTMTGTVGLLDTTPRRPPLAPGAPSPGLLSIGWQANEAGEARVALGEIAGVIASIDTTHEGGASSYSVTVKDEFDADVTGGLLANRTGGTSQSEDIYLGLEGGTRPLAVAGEHFVEITGATLGDRGTVRVYLESYGLRRLERENRLSQAIQ